MGGRIKEPESADSSTPHLIIGILTGKPLDCTVRKDSILNTNAFFEHVPTECGSKCPLFREGCSEAKHTAMQKRSEQT